MAKKKLPKRICARWRHYEGNDEIALQASTEAGELVDLRETCEVGLYRLERVVMVENVTAISDK